MNKQELTETMLYRLECIIGFAQAIHTEIGKGVDLTKEYETIKEVDQKLADLFDTL